MLLLTFIFYIMFMLKHQRLRHSIHWYYMVPILPKHWTIRGGPSSNDLKGHCLGEYSISLHKYSLPVNSTTSCELLAIMYVHGLLL